MITSSTRQVGWRPLIRSATQRVWARARGLPRVPILRSLGKIGFQWQVLQEVAVQPVQALLLPLEAEVNL
jgi:hypothetical protein